MSLVISLSSLSSLYHHVLGYSYFIHLVSVLMLQRSSLASLLCWYLCSIMLFFFLNVHSSWSLLLVFNVGSFIHFITQHSLLFLFFTEPSNKTKETFFNYVFSCCWTSSFFFRYSYFIHRDTYYPLQSSAIYIHSSFFIHCTFSEQSHPFIFTPFKKLSLINI